MSKQDAGVLMAAFVLVTAIGFCLLVANYILNIRRKNGYFWLETGTVVINGMCWILWIIAGIAYAASYLNTNLFHF